MAIRLPLGGIQKVSHVLYSLGITKNLISVGYLADKGFSLEFMRNKCIIKNSEGHFVGYAYRHSVNGLYKLQGDTLMGCNEVSSLVPEVCALSLSNSRKAALWHKRLGHYHFQGMTRMMQYGIVKGLPNISISNFPCSSCILRK